MPLGHCILTFSGPEVGNPLTPVTVDAMGVDESSFRFADIMTMIYIYIYIIYIRINRL